MTSPLFVMAITAVVAVAPGGWNVMNFAAAGAHNSPSAIETLARYDQGLVILSNPRRESLRGRTYKAKPGVEIGSALPDEPMHSPFNSNTPAVF
jgi:hypothetical protein